MYPTSTAYKVAIKRNVRDVKITGTITLKDSTVINISDEDVLQGSLYLTEQCVSGEDIEVGNVYASELGLTLTSPPENPYSLDGARIIINFGINVESDPEEDPLWEYVPLGYFYVTEIERKQTTVNLKALDGLILFDVDLDGVLTTGTPYALVSSCCTKAGVTLATSSATFAAFANGGSSFTLLAESKIETCRDLIMWVCQITGTFARMNRLGQLEIIPVTAGSSVKTISKPERFTSDVSDFYVKITKVAMKVGEEEYSQGTDGMTLTLEENPLLAGKSEAEINAALAEILDQVTEAEYTPYNLTCAGDPALQAGDWVKLTGVSNIHGPEFEYSRNSVAFHPKTGEEIPEDTPVFVDFAAGKKGSLMVEGTENLLAAEQSLSFDVWTKLTGVTVEEGVAVSPTGSMDADRINGLGEESGDRIIAVCLSEQSVSGRTFVFSVWLKGEGENVGKSVEVQIKRHLGTLVGAETMVTLTDEWIRCVTPPFTGSEDNIGIRAVLRSWGSGDYASSCLAWRPQVEEKSYPTPWHIGGSTRAAPLKRITLPEALPATFGIGIAAKMLHAHDAADRTFWECGDYRCYFDADDEKIKLTNGTDTAELGAVWDADDYVGVYAGRENGNLFLQAKIAGALTDRVEAEAGAGAGTGETLYVGSRADGSESVNAVVADMVFHDRPEDIDPEGYLSAIPGGGGE